MTQCRSTKYEGFCEKRPADDGSLGLFIYLTKNAYGSVPLPFTILNRKRRVNIKVWRFD